MAWIETARDEDAEGELLELFDQVRDPETGEVDEIMRIHSHHPAGLAGHFALYSAVMRGTPSLRKVEREMIALVVSTLNQCHY